MGTVSSSGRASAFILNNRVIGGSSPVWGPLVSQMEMITVQCDFIGLFMVHTKNVKKNGTREGTMTNVECSVLCIIMQS